MKYYGKSYQSRFDYFRESSRCRFSLFCKKKAESIGIQGYIKNKNNGSVFLTAQGLKNDIDSLIKWCHLGSPYSIVKSVEIIHKPIETVSGFHIIY